MQRKPSSSSANSIQDQPAQTVPMTEIYNQIVRLWSHGPSWTAKNYIATPYLESHTCITVTQFLSSTNVTETLTRFEFDQATPTVLGCIGLYANVERRLTQRSLFHHTCIQARCMADEWAMRSMGTPVVPFRNRISQDWFRTWKK